MTKQRKGTASLMNPSTPHRRSVKAVLHRLLLILCIPLAFAGSVSSAVAQSWTKIPNSGAVTSAAVLANGTILGVGMDKGLWTRATLTSEWKQVPNSGAVISIAVLADGTILGVGMDKGLWTRATLTSEWKQVPNSGAVISVSVMADGTILGVGTDNQLWARATLTGQWKQLPDSGPITSVVAMPNGLILGVGTDNTLQTQSKDSLLVGNAGSANQSATNPTPPWVTRSLTGIYLPLAAQAEIWSDPKPFLRKGGPITVQSRFMGQHGTTCKFEVQFNNVGTKAIDESLIIARPGKAAVSQYDFPLRAKLAAGTSVAYGTEVRECPAIWGKSPDMTKCASCEPMVYFVGQ